MQQFVHRANKAILGLYYRLRNIWPLWYYALNFKAGRHWKQNRPLLSPLQQKIVEDLFRDGIAITHVSDLFPESDFFSPIRQFVFEKVNEPENQKKISAQREILVKKLSGGEGLKKGERYFTNFLWSQTDPPVLDLANPLIRFVLDQTIVDSVNGYLELLSRFSFFHLGLTIPIEEGTTPFLSQRWHRDPDDKKLVKVFLYCTDVPDTGAGPFMYVKGSQYGGRWRDLFPQRPPVGFYPDIGAVEKNVPDGDIKVCIGRAGTVIFCDTSGLHRGGYCTKAERIMFTGGFVSPAALPQYQSEYTLTPGSDVEVLPFAVKNSITLKK